MKERFLHVDMVVGGHVPLQPWQISKWEFTPKLTGITPAMIYVWDFCCTLDAISISPGDPVAMLSGSYFCRTMPKWMVAFGVITPPMQ